MNTPQPLPAPTPADFKLLVDWMRPFRLYHRPVWINTYRMDTDRPVMYVMNHNLFGYEYYLLVTEVFRKWRKIIRGLGHRDFFQLPGWDTLVDRWGIVPGSQENGDIIMGRGESIGVTPGGNHEAAKMQGQKYQLIWGERLGFARLAIRHHYLIQPIAVVGPDDCFDIWMNPEEVKKSPMWKFLKTAGLVNKMPGSGDFAFPFVTGVGLTPFPKPMRFYYALGEPVDAAQFNGHENEENAWAIRNQTENSLSSEIRETLRFRAKQEDKINRPFF